MKPWLKGGIIGLVVILILIISYFTLFYESAEFCSKINYNSVMCTLQSIVMGLIGIALIPIASILIHPKEGTQIIGFILYLSIIYFLIGAIIGWIIGKIKSKKQ